MYTTKTMHISPLFCPTRCYSEIKAVQIMVAALTHKVSQPSATTVAQTKKQSPAPPAK